MACRIGLTLETFGTNSHESHYHTSHSFVCHVCRRVFVSNFLLEVHLEENHDSYFQVLSPRIDMYRCLVESCCLKFRTSDLRKDHLVTVHKFPAPFSFHAPINQKARKTKPAKKKPRENKTKDSCNTAMETTDLNPNESSSPLSSSTSSSTNTGTCITGVAPSPSSVTASQSGVPPSLAMEVDVRRDASQKPIFKGQQQNRSKKQAQRSRGGRGGRVPPTICFGRGSQRAFQHQRGGARGRHWHQGTMDVDTTVDIEKVDFTDLVESLEG
ncbi:zinc finger protein 511-like [Elysia marginata]|uniref:Zinc finger protein 511-like n=1 Tax=Elysia marginata TaxID=1093978 RepID=A0AAV4GAR1_9GAST|nr:zinc finger protein 511-like [Elysia marginata]